MGAAEILALINGLLGLSMRAWESARQVYGETAIPEWDALADKNALLQAKIDAEKG